MPLVRVRYTERGPWLYLCHDGSSDGYGLWPKDAPHPLANVSTARANIEKRTREECGLTVELVEE